MTPMTSTQTLNDYACQSTESVYVELSRRETECFFSSHLTSFTLVIYYKRLTEEMYGLINSVKMTQNIAWKYFVGLGLC